MKKYSFLIVASILCIIEAAAAIWSVMVDSSAMGHEEVVAVAVICALVFQLAKEKKDAQQAGLPGNSRGVLDALAVLQLAAVVVFGFNLNSDSLLLSAMFVAVSLVSLALLIGYMGRLQAHS